MTDPRPDSYDYGAFSPVWLTKMLVTFLPRANLNLGVIKLLDFLVYSEPDSDISPIDVFVQYATTGDFIPTKDHECAEGEECERNDWTDPLRGYRDAFLGLETATDAEKEDLIRRFTDVLGSIPEVKDDETDD